MNAKRLLLSLLPLLAIAAHVAWVGYLQVSAVLPSPLATHWGPSGQADGFSSVEEHLVLSSLIMGVFAIAWLYVVNSRRTSPIVRKFLIVILACVQLTILGIFTFAIFTQIGLDDARDARFGLEFVAVLLIPIAFLLAIFLSMPKVDLSENLRIVVRGMTFLRLPYSQIESVSVGRASWKEFGGLGLRIAGKKIAFLPSSGDVVQLNTSFGDQILVRSNQANSEAQRIRERIGQ